MSIDLGRVMPVPKGAYDATTAYTRLDIVTSGGSSYMCLVSNTGKAVTDATYWLLLAKAGSDGKPGASAYEVAVNSGYNGTQEAWLASLKGPAGADGQPGKDGKDGAPGTPGTDGKTPYLHIAYADSADGEDGFYVGGGTNLLTGTSSEYKPVPDSATLYSGGLIYALSSADITNIGGQTITIRAYIKNTASIPVALRLYYNNKFYTGNNIDVNSEGYSTVTATLPLTSSSGTDISIRGNGPTSGIQYKKFKLENGSVATPWSPAPSEAHPIYMGTYTDYTQVDSLDPTAYLWSQIKGDTGPTGPQGPQGIQGPTGATGPAGTGTKVTTYKATLVNCTSDSVYCYLHVYDMTTCKIAIFTMNLKTNELAAGTVFAQFPTGVMAGMDGTNIMINTTMVTVDTANSALKVYYASTSGQWVSGTAATQY